MCGILGAFGFTIDSIALKNSLADLIHRGPDSQGFREFPGNCFMGVARLAMTDPHPRSNQPLVSVDNEYAISFNGEIYNFKKIRKNLERESIKFQTESDTEVLLELINAKGLAALNQIEGMFAIAYYDVKNQKLTLARDSLGKKPLYFTIVNNGIYWSSSLESIAKLVKVEYGNYLAIQDYMSLGYQLDPNTGYEGIYSLLPGHYLEFCNKDNIPIPRPFPIKVKTKSINSSLRDELWNAIQVRIDGHNKVGLSLSGGVDSTLVAIGLKALGIRANTFSAYWSDSDKARYNSDSEHAERVAASLGHEFTAVDISENFSLRETLRKYLFTMEEPNNNPSGLSTLKLYKSVADSGIKLLLTGDGSDEIFGGYRRHELVASVPRFVNIKNHFFDNLLFSSGTGVKRFFSSLIASQLSSENPDLWLYWHLVFSPKELSRMFGGAQTAKEISSTLNSEVGLLSPAINRKNVTSNIMKRDHEIWLSMESNRKLDRVSMKYSIEARSPFQDENVIFWAQDAMEKSSYKILNKGILKKEFPELNRLPIKDEKVGFTSPIGHWMRQDPDFINSSLNYLSQMKDFNKNFIEGYKNAQFKSDYRTNMQLWTLVVYANWIMIKNGD